jgi:hypothetical protein
VFCPNCGTQNDSAATPCKKCGFKLSGVSIPKFKGTMMLNSDQTVQELIDDHRKQAQGGAQERAKARASQPPPASAPSAPPPSIGRRSAVLQPPRAAGGSAKRRMGGTMLGVAPQGGAVLPPQAPVAAPSPPQVPDVEPSRSEPPEASAGASATAAPDVLRPDEGPADPLAGTYQMPTSEPPTPASEPEAAAPRATRPVAAAATPRATRPMAATSDPALQGDNELPRGRPLAATAALPVQPEPVPASGAEPMSRAATPPRLRALDILLLVCTLGMYGFVLRARRNKAAATPQP